MWSPISEARNQYPDASLEDIRKIARNMTPEQLQECNWARALNQGLKRRRNWICMRADAVGVSSSAYLSNTLYSNARGFEHSVQDRYEEQTIARWHEFWPQRTGKTGCRFTKSVIRAIFKSLNITPPPMLATIDDHTQSLQEVYAARVLSSK